MTDWRSQGFGLPFGPFRVQRRDYWRVHSSSTWVLHAWWVLDGQGDIVGGGSTEAEATAEAERLSEEAAA